VGRARQLGRVEVFVNLSRNAIRQSPEYKADSIPTRDYETGLHGHYDRPGYWVEELAAKEHSIESNAPGAARSRGMQRRN